MSVSSRPTPALAIGDSSGISPELVAIIGALPEVRLAAKVVVIDNTWAFAEVAHYGE